MNREINFCCDQTYLGKLRNSYTKIYALPARQLDSAIKCNKKKKKDLGESPIQ